MTNGLLFPRHRLRPDLYPANEGKPGSIHPNYLENNYTINTIETTTNEFCKEIFFD